MKETAYAKVQSQQDSSWQVVGCGGSEGAGGEFHSLSI